MKANNPIIIVGNRRSGTTLLRTILENHPDLLVHPKEPQFLLELYHRFSPEITRVRAASDYLSTHRYVDVPADVIRAHFSHYEMLSLRELSRTYLELWGGERLETKRPVLKYPAFVFHLDLIFDWFPDATIIHIVRDPRANVSSQRARWPKATLWECISWWRDSISAVQRARLQHAGKVFELTYESLVLEPALSVEKLCAELNLPYSDQLIEFQLEMPVFAPGEVHSKIFNRPDASRLDLWKTYLSPLEVRLIETACQLEMRAWNYEFTNPDVPAIKWIPKYFWEVILFKLVTVGRILKGTNWRG